MKNLLELGGAALDRTGVSTIEWINTQTKEEILGGASDTFVELAPWLEHLDQLLQQYLFIQQQRRDDHSDLKELLMPADLLQETLRQPRGAPHWAFMSASTVPERKDADDPPLIGRLEQLVQRFALSPFETRALLLCSLPLFEPRYALLFACIQDDSQACWPSVDIVLDVLSTTPMHRIKQRRCLASSQARLLRHGLLITVERNGRESERADARFLRASNAVFHYLNGDDDALPRELVDLAYWLLPVGPDMCAASSKWAALAQSVARACFDQPAAVRTPLLLLQGAGGRAQLVARIAAEVGVSVLSLRLSALPEETGDAWRVLLAALRETKLRGACLLLRDLADFEMRFPMMEAFEARLTDHGQPIICLIQEDEHVCGFPALPRLCLSTPARALEVDVALVRAELAQVELATDMALDSLLKRTHVHPDTLVQTIQEAQWYCLQREDRALLDESDLHRAMCLRAQQNFGRLAQRVQPRRKLGDLIVSEELQGQLKEILAAIRQREVVLGRGFECKLAYGTGISALFYGDSGTGKTMAAEVLAGELGVDLIRVDLSTVVNKYIGETEKNLSKIFDLAAADTGVLLFDEADALFGRRSEVKDAQDRHANIEVSYLLQRLESYPGLVVLSTNNRGHLDEAFSRRLTFITRFDFPDAALRERMWRAIWPSQITLAKDIDFKWLAKCAEINGASIRNIALLASWLASDKGCPVELTDIKQALRRELSKTGRLMPQDL